MSQAWYSGNQLTVLIKPESTYGTEAVPTPSANAVRVRSLKMDPVRDMTKIERLRPQYAVDGMAPGAVYWDIEIELDVKGPENGTPDVIEAAALLKAAGFAMVTGASDFVFSPSSRAAAESCTIYAFTGGDGAKFRCFKATGCVFTPSLSIPANGIAVWKFTGRGLYVAPTVDRPSKATIASVDSPTKVTLTAGHNLPASGTADFVDSTGNVIHYRQAFTCAANEVTVADTTGLGAGDFVDELPTYHSADDFAIGMAATLTFDSVSLVATKVDIEWGHEVVERRNVGAATGFAGFKLALGQPVIKVDPETVAAATLDLDTLIDARTEEAFELVIPTRDSGQWTFAASAAHLGNYTLDRAALERANLEIYPVDTNGDDCLTITAERTA